MDGSTKESSCAFCKPVELYSPYPTLLSGLNPYLVCSGSWLTPHRLIALQRSS